MNALTIAKYIICETNKLQKEITQLKLQKLLYFVEAYYMAMYDKNELFQEEFYAWTYGPVCKEVYDEYKVYMNLPIPAIDCENLSHISEEVEDAIKKVCDLFGKFSTTELIRLTHMKNSPWYNTYKNSNIPISKIETKNWFRDKFVTSGN